MSKKNAWALTLGAMVLGIAIVGVSGCSGQRASTATLQAELDAANAEKQAAVDKAAAAQQELDALKASQSASASAEATKPAGSSSGTSTPAKVVTVKQFSFVTKVTEGSTNKITADYAQMLTGKAAAKAATAHGDESPPPNDYYIVNDNKMLRKLSVKGGIKVTVTSNADGTADPSGHTVSFAKWASYYSAPDEGNDTIRTAPYWLTIKNGVVTAISQQYLP